MPLPIGSAPRPPGGPPDDIATRGWAALTARIAWTLLAQGVRIRPQVLRDARDHALLQLDPTTPLHHAEDLAEHHTRRFVQRARRKPWRDPWPQDAAMPLSPRWREAVLHALDAHSAAVFRLHYGDGRSIDQVAAALDVDALTIETTCGGLREVVRTAACRDGLQLEEWPPERVDRLGQRLAGLSIGPCPPLTELVDGKHVEHRPLCPRCDRIIRLLKSGAITYEDLLSPGGGARPRDQAVVVALGFHPDARGHRALIARERDLAFLPVGDDALILDGSDLDAVRELVELAARVGAPDRDHLRGIVVRGPGRWSSYGLLGGLADRAMQEIRSVPWATVDGLGELPEQLPPPPSPRRAWVAVGALAALTASLVAWSIDPPPPDADAPLQVEFTEGRGGVWTEFDVQETAHVALVRATDRGVEVVLDPADPTARVGLATGDGRYRVHTQGQGVLLASTSTEHFNDLVDAVAAEDDPLTALRERLAAADPGADVHVFHR